ncbi:FaeA/PapI family transcriptional regulator [Inquilinus limosus]|uniref:Transcriptional regulator n=1 Tax=Inquilinus limosus MP06 TaxID=1398085 RepID=A0A0A0DDH4_9PROT|nr:FaeA/PapI family transcriptional regulator [Inquilinus limosus]KGM36169.1 hypothetical protein P409_00545 [Inquilinus limosus MP06]
MSDIERRILTYLSRYKKEIGAMWTADIAYGLRESTPFIRKILVKLEKDGKVRRVVIGNPTSWELAE